jgi:hypothetical protein
MCSTLVRLVAAVGLAGMAGLVQAAAPVPVGGKAGEARANARKALDEIGDFKYESRSLAEMVEDLKARTKLPITVDPVVYQFGFDPSLHQVNVNLKSVKLRDGLNAALAPQNLRFGFVREGILISTEEGLTSRQLRQRVSVDCHGTGFAAAAKALADDTGANVVLDPRLKDRANAAVDLKLDDVPLETAIRLLAEVADLRAVRMSNVLFVTSPERAEKLRPDADGPVPASPFSPFLPVPPPGGIGFGGGFGGVVVPDMAVEAPAVPPAPAAPPPPPAPPKQ